MWDSLKKKLLAKNPKEVECAEHGFVIGKTSEEQNSSKPKEVQVEKITVKINGKEYKANRILNESLNYICIQDLEQAGFDIGYDVGTKVPSISSKTNEFKIHVDDKEKTVESILSNDRNYVQMRELADSVGNFSVEYTDNQVVIKTAEQPKAAKK